MFCLYNVIVLLLLAVSSASPAKTTKDSWDYAPPGVKMTVNGKEYLFSSYNVTGTLKDAHMYCESKDMYLVAFDADGEFDEMQQVITDNFRYIPMFWTSGFKTIRVDFWIWSSTKSVFKPNATYWSQPDQPDEWSKGDVCVTLNQPDYKWHDNFMGACEWEMNANFICEAFETPNDQS